MSYIGPRINLANVDSFDKKQARAIFKSNTYEVKTTGFDAYSGMNYLVDTSGTPITLYLPENPNDHDSIEIIDIGGMLSSNELTINRNGNLIMGLSEDLTAFDDYTKIRLTFIGLSYGWVLT